MNLGENKEEILKSFKDIIASVDAKGLLKEGTNPIRTKLNGFDIELKVHIIDGKVISFNGYMGHSDRIWPNTILFF